MNMKTNWFRNSSLAAAAMTLLAAASLAQGTYHSNGVSNCNCTKSPAELQVCMTRTIEIELVGGRRVRFERDADPETVRRLVALLEGGAP